MPSKLHQQILFETIDELNQKGYFTIDLTGMIPDAIAIKDNKFYAVEVLIVNDIPNDWQNLPIVQNKRIKYSSFDEIIFKISNKKLYAINEIIPSDKKGILKNFLTLKQDKKMRAKRANQIVQDFIDNELKIKGENTNG
jgi:hypothetical protein